MYSCIIIDDEAHAVESLKGYVNNFADLKLVATYTDPLIALKSIEHPVDLILMDIDMPRINGIELAKSLRRMAKKLVFSTGHTKYGYEAFRVKADDYLLKPYTLGEFLLSMNRIFPTTNHVEKPLDRNSTFLVKSKEDDLKIFSVKFSDIIAVESKMNYVLIHTTAKKILTYMTLTEISEILVKYPGFLRFQRSFIIAEEYIESIAGNSIRMVNGCEMTVGEYYRKDFAMFISSKLFKTRRK